MTRTKLPDLFGLILDPVVTAASVACTVRTDIISARNWILLLAVVLLYSVGSVSSQEAVTEKPVTSAEETPGEAEAPAKTEKQPATEGKSAKGIRETMTPEEFTASGLDKLSPAELEYLDAWLKGYRHTAEKKAAEKATAEVTAKVSSAKPRLPTDAMFSRVDGTLGPLTGRTIIKLQDGTTWKQANAEDRYRPRVTDHPTVMVSHSAFGYKMQIEGMPAFYVNPVREK